MECGILKKSRVTLQKRLKCMIPSIIDEINHPNSDPQKYDTLKFIPRQEQTPPSGGYLIDLFFML